MTVLEFLVAISPILLGLTATLLLAVALIQPRRVPARNVSQIREVPFPR
jgi:hypothetical protein